MVHLRNALQLQLTYWCVVNRFYIDLSGESTTNALLGFIKRFFMLNGVGINLKYIDNYAAQEHRPKNRCRKPYIND